MGADCVYYSASGRKKVYEYMINHPQEVHYDAL